MVNRAMKNESTTIVSRLKCNVGVHVFNMFLGVGFAGQPEVGGRLTFLNS